MYEWLWRVLPGPTWGKVVQCLLLFVAVVLALFGWVFPAIESHLPFTQVTVDAGAAMGYQTGERM